MLRNISVTFFWYLTGLCSWKETHSSCHVLLHWPRVQQLFLSTFVVGFQRRDGQMWTLHFPRDFACLFTSWSKFWILRLIYCDIMCSSLAICKVQTSQLFHIVVSFVSRLQAHLWQNPVLLRGPTHPRKTYQQLGIVAFSCSAWETFATWILCKRQKKFWSTMLALPIKQIILSFHNTVYAYYNCSLHWWSVVISIVAKLN